MSEQDLDKNETATPYKLLKAREKGQVAKSSEVISLATFLAAITYVSWMGFDYSIQQFKLDRSVFSILDSISNDNFAPWFLVQSILAQTIQWTAPLMLLVVIAAILGNILQTGPIFSFSPLSADFSRINPVNGFKKIMSVRTLFDTARACIKFILLCAAAYYALRQIALEFFHISNLAPLAYLKLLIEDTAGLGFKMAMILACIAFLDLIFTKREFLKKMRMSKREVKDEHKQRDGDPRIRSRMRELRNEARKRSQALRQTQTASVVLTNPTHVAIALRYVHGEMDAPVVVAKGAGHVATVIRGLAAKHHIPVVRSPSLARRLFKELDVNHQVPPHLFAEVARIIVWILAMRERDQSPQSS
ncbi:EscU/YscU/HrcU family type III secretion system export apparatus switch protein [Comamonas sediminis]|uniref:Flagellar biosynthesis protein FlhB n=1 Tax=Comamonas sediminis TaxID=1783360 RepID=A0ABV4B200_9BURK